MNEENRPIQLTSLRKRVQELREAAHQLELELNAVEADQGAPLGNGSPLLDLPGINRALQNLAACSTQEEILDTYLEEVRKYLGRAVLFMETDGKYTPWKSLGFVPESIEEVTVDSPEDPVVRAARESRIFHVGEQLEESFSWISGTGYAPQAAICLPLKVGDSVPLVLYADANHSIAVDSVELLTHLTELVVKNHFLAYVVSNDSRVVDRGESVSPGAMEETASSIGEPSDAATHENSKLSEAWKALEDTEESSPPQLDVDPASREIPPTEREKPPTGSEFIFGEQVEEPPVEDTEGARDDFQIEERQTEDVQAEETSFQLGNDRDVRSLHTSDSVTTELDDETEEAPPLSKEIDFLRDTDDTSAHSVSWEGPGSVTDEQTSTEQPSKEAGSSATDEDVEGKAFALPEETAADTKSTFVPTFEPTSFSSSQEEAIHREAQRFARLLVSEVKLYNEEEVERGRKDSSLYSRLQKDIDRSRQMYEKRVHPSVKSNTDYFHNELVRILARNDGDLLGSGYPGPRLVD